MTAQTEANRPRVVIAAGGTGGHIFPALAVAQSLFDRGITPVWVGSNRGLEARVVREQAGFALTELTLEGVRGRGVAGLLALPIGLMRSLVTCWRVLAQAQPGLVLVFGGYVSFPVGLAARLQGRTLVVHEQNAVMGSANRWLSRLAHGVLTSFATTRYAPSQAVVVGNPVRAAIAHLAQTLRQRPQRVAGPLRVLVIGGSLGARALNKALPSVWQRLTDAWPEGCAVWHQTGAADHPVVCQAYADLPIPPADLRVDAFIDDMAQAYTWADLVVCRAGASTVAELAALGLPAVLVPLPNAIDDHQTANARALVELGAALLVPQTETLADDLTACLGLLTRARLQAMAGAAQSLQAGEALARLLAALSRLWPVVAMTPSRAGAKT